MRIDIDNAWCKGCALCVATCPKQVLAMGETRSKRGYLMPFAARPEHCIACMMCERICPDLCIDIQT